MWAKIKIQEIPHLTLWDKMSREIQWRDAASPCPYKEHVNSYEVEILVRVDHHTGLPCYDGDNRAQRDGVDCIGTIHPQDDNGPSKDLQRRSRGDLLLLRCSVGCPRRRGGNFGRTLENSLKSNKTLNFVLVAKNID